jgi:hypothetical protein
MKIFCSVLAILHACISSPSFGGQGLKGPDEKHRILVSNPIYLSRPKLRDLDTFG